MNIGENIRKYRKEKGLKPCELSKLIYKSESSIWKYESNAVIPPADVLEELAYEGMENWYALYLCIDKKFTVNEAQSCMGIKPYAGIGKSRNTQPSKENIEILVLKNQGYSFEHIANTFNITSNAVRCRLYFLEKRSYQQVINKLSTGGN